MTEQEHYFTGGPAGPDELRPLRVHLAGRDLDLVAAGGVFSPQHVDAGTQVLLRHVPPPPSTGDLLDLGCGWGPLALSLALSAPRAQVWAVDASERAVDLTRRNADRVGLGNVRAVTPDAVPDDVRFDALWSNPPIRVGKAVLHDLLLRWLPRLRPGASAYLVVQRNLGSDSLHRWLDDSFGTRGYRTERAASQKGFRLLAVTAPDLDAADDPRNGPLPAPGIIR